MSWLRLRVLRLCCRLCCRLCFSLCSPHHQLQQ
jgi:hypothetical protein